MTPNQKTGLRIVQLLEEQLTAQRKTNDLLAELVYLNEQLWVNTTTERGPDGRLRPNDNALADLLAAIQKLALESATQPRPQKP